MLLWFCQSIAQTNLVSILPGNIILYSLKFYKIHNCTYSVAYPHSYDLKVSNRYCCIIEINRAKHTDSMSWALMKWHRGRWGNAVMRDKQVFCHYGKTKKGKDILLGQQLHLTMKQIGTKNGQYGFSWFGDYHCYWFFACLI